MASHGVSRVSGVQPATDQERRKEQQKINDYKGLVKSVNERIRDNQLTTETLQLTSKLLKANPEYYTIWNHRRLILMHQFERASFHGPNDDISSNYEALANLISDDLAFLIPILRKFPKCYWIWSYRLWLLQESIRLLPASEAQTFWQQELALAGKMLNLDSRNFHGWGYRRTVIRALESNMFNFASSSTSLTKPEFDYTTKMINSNLSNFSAWHSRSKLIPKLLSEMKADHKTRRSFLDDELELIERALWAGSEDQSLWFYHQYLMSTFDPKCSEETMAPELTGAERTAYVRKEISKVQEMLDGAEDCKWIYQSLIQLNILYHEICNDWFETASHVDKYIDQLIKLDPLRLGRWNDLKAKRSGDVDSSLRSPHFSYPDPDSADIAGSTSSNLESRAESVIQQVLSRLLLLSTCSKLASDIRFTVETLVFLKFPGAKQSNCQCSMSTDSASPNILLQIILCKTETPTASRILSVPSEMTFTELHEAIAAAFGWSIEPCTLWVFNMVDQDPLAATKGNNVRESRTTFTAFWTAPDQGYNATPAQHSTDLAVGLYMKTATVGKHWTYDYNISKQPHVVNVLGTLTNDQAPKLTFLSGFGKISRRTWQFASVVRLEAKIQAGTLDWISDVAALGRKLGEIQDRFEERKKVEAKIAAEPTANSNKRAAPLGSGSAEDDRVPDRAVKKRRVD